MNYYKLYTGVKRYPEIKHRGTILAASAEEALKEARQEAAETYEIFDRIYSKYEQEFDPLPFEEFYADYICDNHLEALEELIDEKIIYELYMNTIEDQLIYYVEKVEKEENGIDQMPFRSHRSYSIRYGMALQPIKLPIVVEIKGIQSSALTLPIAV